MKFEEFKNEIKEKYAEKFSGTCVVKKYVCLGKSIVIDCYLGEAQTGAISDNDMLKVSFNIGLPDKFDYDNDELPEQMTMESWNNHYLINPENQYLTYSSRKVPYRKTTGDAEKLIATAAKFFNKMYNLIREDYDNGNIHKNYIRIVEYNVRETEGDKFNYQLLDRCRCDCEYYLGNGNRHEKHLWAGNVKDHIQKMKELYNLLPVKPEWLSMEKILEYEKLMEN